MHYLKGSKVDLRILPIIILILSALLILKGVHLTVGFSAARADFQDIAQNSILNLERKNSSQNEDKFNEEGGERVNQVQKNHEHTQLSEKSTLKLNINEPGRVTSSKKKAGDISTFQDIENFPPSRVEKNIFKRLNARRAQLDEREAQLNTRENLLRAAEFRLEEQLQTLSIQQKNIEELEQKRQSLESEGLQSIINTYERMKPREAARIFEILDEDILTRVAAGMRTQALAGVLGQMTPDKARLLTNLLAQQYRDPDQDNQTDIGDNL